MTKSLIKNSILITTIIFSTILLLSIVQLLFPSKTFALTPINEALESEDENLNDKLDSLVNIYFFTDQSCKICPQARKELVKFANENSKVKLKEYEVTQLEATYLLKNAEVILQKELKEVPMVFIAVNPVIGEENLYKSIPLLKQQLIAVSNNNAYSLMDDLLILGADQRMLNILEVKELKQKYNIEEIKQKDSEKPQVVTQEEILKKEYENKNQNIFQKVISAIKDFFSNLFGGS